MRLENSMLLIVGTLVSPYVCTTTIDHRNNQVIGQDFVCSKDGFLLKKYVSKKRRSPPHLQSLKNSVQQ